MIQVTHDNVRVYPPSNEPQPVPGLYYSTEQIRVACDADQRTTYRYVRDVAGALKIHGK